MGGSFATLFELLPKFGPGRADLRKASGAHHGRSFVIVWWGSCDLGGQFSESYLPPWSGVEWLYKENSMQLKIFKIDPQASQLGFFDLRLGSGVFV